MRNKKLRLIEVLTIQITLLFKSTLSAKMYKMECLEYCNCKSQVKTTFQESIFWKSLLYYGFKHKNLQSEKFNTIWKV